jgi:bacterioferritin-associated ferredoxin
VKLRCDRDVLAEALQTAQRGVSTRPGIPALTGVLLSVGNEGLTLTTTDLEVTTEFLVVAATLLGLPRATAAVLQLYQRGLPVPAARLALLLGTPPRAAAPADPDDLVVCRCNHVTHRSLAAAWQGGARDVTALVATTRATTGCGGCLPEVTRVCAELAGRTTEHPS